MVSLTYTQVTQMSNTQLLMHLRKQLKAKYLMKPKFDLQAFRRAVKYLEIRNLQKQSKLKSTKITNKLFTLVVLRQCPFVIIRLPTSILVLVFFQLSDKRLPKLCPRNV